MRRIAFIFSAFTLAACSTAPYDLWAGGRDASCENGRFRCFSETVWDPDAGLLWQRDFGEATYAEAKAACDSLAPAHVWRLPTENELLGLKQEGASPQIDLGAFPDTPADKFWSSHEFNVFSTYTVSFLNLAVELSEASEPASFRCVRVGR